MFHENWYSDNQLNDLGNLLTRIKDLDGKIIEIGCWEGKSTIKLANKCFPEILICNDTWLGNIQESIATGITHVTEEILKKRDVYSTFINNMDNHTQKNYIIVKEDCIEWLKNYLNVHSRADIKTNLEAQGALKLLYGQYKEWKNE